MRRAVCSDVRMPTLLWDWGARRLLVGALLAACAALPARAQTLQERAAFDSIRAALAQLADSIKARLSAVEAEIYQVKNRSSQDPLNYPIRLNNKIAALTGVVASADAAPTDQSVRVFEDLSAALQVQLDRLKVVLDVDVPAFNKLVKDSDVPAVILR